MKLQYNRFYSLAIDVLILAEVVAGYPSGNAYHLKQDHLHKWYAIIKYYNMVGSALFPQRALYTVHCTNTMHSRKPPFAITPAVFS